MRGFWQRIRNFFHKETYGTENAAEHAVLEKTFSPLTYENPCIPCVHEVLRRVIQEKKLAYGKMELVVIDAEAREDNGDVLDVLWQVCDGLNYLLIVTDQPDGFSAYAERMYEETGLIVQHAPKSGHSRVRGNLILDFERIGKFAERIIRPGLIYLPIYKKPWEIAENLDIKVPVGYNTLVVDGISLPQRFMDEKTDRLDWDFRKG